jgi:hypothetical protein
MLLFVQHSVLEFPHDTAAIVGAVFANTRVPQYSRVIRSKTYRG